MIDWLNKTRSTAAAMVLLLCTWPIHVAAAQGWNSGSVSTGNVGPLSTLDLSHWAVTLGSASLATSTTASPTGETVMELTITDSNILVDHTLASTADLRIYDCFSFLIGMSATRTGDFVYLMDAHGRRRWFSLNVRAYAGFQAPVLFINRFVDQDPGFDLSAVSAVRFGQAGLQSGDKIWIGTVHFEQGLVSHAEVSGPWIVDLGIGTLSTTNDAAVGAYSVRADMIANDEGQASIGLDARGVNISWDWSRKTFISFYYKDNTADAFHYFLIYDGLGKYREWIFTNSNPGQWIRVTADLSDVSYVQSGPVDLSHIVFFEGGVFGGIPGASYSFQVDEVRVF